MDRYHLKQSKKITRYISKRRSIAIDENNDVSKRSRITINKNIGVTIYNTTKDEFKALAYELTHVSPTTNLKKLHPTPLSNQPSMLNYGHVPAIPITNVASTSYMVNKYSILGCFKLLEDLVELFL